MIVDIFFYHNYSINTPFHICTWIRNQGIHLLSIHVHIHSTAIPMKKASITAHWSQDGVVEWCPGSKFSALAHWNTATTAAETPTHTHTHHKDHSHIPILHITHTIHTFLSHTPHILHTHYTHTFVLSTAPLIDSLYVVRIDPPRECPRLLLKL